VRENGVELFAVSVDAPDVSRRLRERLNVRFTFLSDPDGVLLDDLGIRHRGGGNGRDIAFPTAILVDEAGLIRWTYQSDTYRERARPEEVFAAIEGLVAAGR
jgi:peroxiredoxin